MNQYAIEMSRLVKGMIFSPISELDRIKNGLVNRKTVYQIFFITMIITFIRTLYAKQLTSCNFFYRQYVNEYMVFMSNPFILLIGNYLAYFMGIFLAVEVCKLISLRNNCSQLLLLIMSVSVIGIVAQGLFLPLNYILSEESLTKLFALCRLWNLILILFSIKVASSLSYFKSFIILIIVQLIIIISTLAIFPLMSPYLLFLN